MSIQPCGRSARVWVCGCGWVEPSSAPWAASRHTQHLGNKQTLDLIIWGLAHSKGCHHGLQDHQEDPGGGGRGPEC